MMIDMLYKAAIIGLLFLLLHYLARVLWVYIVAFIDRIWRNDD